MTANRHDVSQRSSPPAIRHAGPFETSRWQRARRQFLKVFPGGFHDETYLAWERDYKWSAHRECEAQLGRDQLAQSCQAGKFAEAAAAAVRIESGRSLLFSFEKMALRDAVRQEEGARTFVQGLNEYLYGGGTLADRFEQWCVAITALPRKQTRVLTWPLVTVFGFIAQPKQHLFLKPLAMKMAARKLGYDFPYRSRPSWETYDAYLHWASTFDKRSQAMLLETGSMCSRFSGYWAPMNTADTPTPAPARCIWQTRPAVS